MFPRSRLIRFIFLQYYCVVLVGAPIPIAVGETARQTTEPEQAFPCAGRMCGCSANHCWSSCCCHTLAERLDWARKNNVRPPKTAIEDAIRAGLDVSFWCAANTNPRREQLPASKTAKHHKCCQSAKTTQNTIATEDGENSESKVSASEGVIILKAMSCRGIALAWSTVVAAPLPSSIMVSPPRVIEQLDVANPQFELPDSPEPPTPPPRPTTSRYI